MDINIVDFEDVLLTDNAKIGTKILLLPEEYNRKFKGKQSIVYNSNTSNILKILKNNKIKVEYAYGELDEIVFHENRSSDWFGPAILFTLELINQNPLIVSVVINIISNYIYDIFKTKKENPNARCSFVYFSTKRKKEIQYDGPVSGLTSVVAIIKDLADKDNDNR